MSEKTTRNPPKELLKLIQSPFKEFKVWKEAEWISLLNKKDLESRECLKFCSKLFSFSHGDSTTEPADFSYVTSSDLYKALSRLIAADIRIYFALGSNRQHDRIVGAFFRHKSEKEFQYSFYTHKKHYLWYMPSNNNHNLYSHFTTDIEVYSYQCADFPKIVKVAKEMSAYGYNILKIKHPSFNSSNPIVVELFDLNSPEREVGLAADQKSLRQILHLRQKYKIRRILSDINYKILLPYNLGEISFNSYEDDYSTTFEFTNYSGRNTCYHFVQRDSQDNFGSLIDAINNILKSAPPKIKLNSDYYEVAYRNPRQLRTADDIRCAIISILQEHEMQYIEKFLT